MPQTITRPSTMTPSNGPMPIWGVIVRPTNSTGRLSASHALYQGSQLPLRGIGSPPALDTVYVY